MRVPTNGPSWPMSEKMVNAAVRFESSSWSDDVKGSNRPIDEKRPDAARKTAK